VVYGQVQSGPGPGANAMLVQKDRPGLPGGWQLAIVNDSGTLRLQAYTKDEAADGLHVGSSSGVGQVQADAAFMLVMTCGGSGTRLYLDKAEIGSTTNGVGLLDNDEQIGIGRYRPGISDSAGFTGWLDEVRFYKGVLTPDEIAALPSAQDLVILPVQQAAYTVPAVPTAPSGTTRYVSSGVGTGAPAAGNDSSGNGTIGNPYRTVAKALSVANSGDQIILRKGIYREGGLNVADTNLTIKGYNQDIDDDPLDPDNWPILDGSIDMSSVTWELVHAGRQEYRTVQTNLVSGTKIGCAILPGTGPYVIPRWEPLSGWIEPRKLVRLPSYAQEGTTGAWSWTDAFRHTGAVTHPSTNYYLGPGVARGSDGRIHIRLQPVHSSVTGGVTMDEFPDNNPVSNSIFLWSQGRSLFANMQGGFTLEGVFCRGFDRIRQDITNNDVTFRRNVFWGGDFQSTLITWTGGSNPLFQHNVGIAGLSDWHVWGSGKHSGFWTNVDSNYGRCNIVGISGSATNGRIIDNLLLRNFDISAGSTSAAFTIEIANNAIEVIDDLTQLDGLAHEHIHHNFVVGPLCGCSGGTPPAGNRYDIHHNICVLTRWRAWRETLMWSWTVYTPHSPEHGRNYTIAHNTIIFTNPRRESSSAVTSILSPGPSGLRHPTSPEFQDLFNNNFIVVNRDPPGVNGPGGPRGFHGGWDVNSTVHRGRLDGNAYWKVDLDGLSGGNLFGQISHSGGNSANFASLAAFKASQHFQESKDLYAPGMENSGIQANPQFVGGADAFVNEGRGVPPRYYIPQSPVYHTGAINLGSGGLNLGLPGYTYEAWRGALDPDGDGTEIGPRPT
jgi:hypothetical protein